MRPLSRDQLGALAHRPFRMLFAATLVTSLGTHVAFVALAFAVLGFGDATDLGIVLAVRQVASGVVLLLGGVLSDRLARNRMLAAAALLQGVAQGGTAASVLSGHPTLGAFAAFAFVWGLGDGLIVPAETALVPETVPAAQLQQANALQGLSRNTVGIAGPAIGGVLVVAAGSGWALAVDAASCVVCALLLIQMPAARRGSGASRRFAAELREGWRVFRTLGWLWPTSLLFGISNVFFGFWFVLGPAIAKDRLGGAGAWAAILVAAGVGSVLGGLFAMRHRPYRPLLASILWSATVVLELAVLAGRGSAVLVAVVAGVAGFGLAVHMALWYTVLQTEVAEETRSRVISFDALGSFVLNPVGTAMAGPAAVLLGSGGALWLAAGAVALCTAAMLSIRAVRAVVASGSPTPTT